MFFDGGYMYSPLAADVDIGACCVHTRAPTAEQLLHLLVGEGGVGRRVLREVGPKVPVPHTTRVVHVGMFEFI